MSDTRTRLKWFQLYHLHDSDGQVLINLERALIIRPYSLAATTIGFGDGYGAVVDARFEDIHYFITGRSLE